MLTQGVGGFPEVEGGINPSRGASSVLDRGFDVLDGRPQGHDSCPKRQSSSRLALLGTWSSRGASASKLNARDRAPPVVVSLR
jgi:hypothetical protein